MPNDWLELFIYEIGYDYIRILDRDGYSYTLERSPGDVPIPTMNTTEPTRGPQSSTARSGNDT